MLRLRLHFPLLATTFLLSGCGGRTNGQPPSDQSSDAPNTTAPSSAGSQDLDGSTPDVEQPSSTPEESPNTTTNPATAPSSDHSAAPGASTDVTPTVDVDGGMLTSPPVIVDPPPAVCEGQCGNDVVDSCEICGEWRGQGSDTLSPGLPIQELAAPPIEPVCTTLTEQCDGALAAEQTCEAIGFAGGTLSCRQVCRYDDSDCDSCLVNIETQACRDDLAVGATPSFVALATNATQLVAAWNEGCAAKVGWFDAALEILHTTDLTGAACISATAGITLAPLANSWVAEIGNKQFVLDSSGEVVSQRTILGTALFAAARSGDTPLVVRQTTYGTVTASLLDASGAEVWTREVAEQVIEAHYGSATAVSDGFLVALRTDVGVQVFHLDETGAILDVSTPGSASTEYPQLNASGGEVRLVWADFGATPSLQWAALNEQGERIGDAVQIGSVPDYFNRSPIVVAGEDTVVVLGGYTGGTGIGKATHVRRLDVAGATSAGDVAVQSDPNLVQWPQVVAYDGSFVTAWVGKGESGRVGLAKIDL